MAKKMGDGICCPVGEICEEPEEKEEYVNPYAVPYVQSEHLMDLIAKKARKEEKVKVVQKKT